MSTRKKRRKALSALIGGVLLLALIVGAVLFIINGGSVDFPDFGGIGGEDVSEFYLGASSSSGAYAALDGGLAMATATDVSFINSAGEETVRENVLYTNPAIAAGGKLAVAYDLGGESFAAFNKSSVLLNTEAQGKITDISVNSSGWFAVSSVDSGSKGLVTVYNSDMEAVYRWYSNEGYVVAAEVSPDNRSMAAATVLAGGSRIVEYSLSSTELDWEYSVPDSVALSVRYLTSNRLAVISDRSCVTLDSKGGEVSAYDYSSGYLRAFADGSRKFTALLLSDYQMGSQYRLVTLDENGKLEAEAATDMQVCDMSSYGESLAVLYSGAFAVYDEKLQPQKQQGGISGGTGILARSGGEAIVIYSHTAEIY